MSYKNTTEIRRMSEKALEEGNFHCHICLKKAVKFFHGESYCLEHFKEEKRKYNREYHDKYYKKNREKCLEIQKKSAKKNFDKNKKYHSKYYKNHREEMILNSSKYYQKNREDIIKKRKETEQRIKQKI